MMMGLKPVGGGGWIEKAGNALKERTAVPDFQKFPHFSTFVFLMGPRAVSKKGIKGIGVNSQRGFLLRFIWS